MRDGCRETSANFARFDSATFQHRSLRALRRLLLAFRAAARMDEESSEGSGLSYVVESAAGESLLPSLHPSF